MTTRLDRRTRDTFIWVLAIPVILGGLSFWAGSRYRQSIALVLHTQDVLLSINSLLGTLSAAESNQRGYLLSGEEPYRQRYSERIGEIPPELAHLRFLTLDNPTQRANLDRLSPAVIRRTTEMRQVLALCSAGALPGAAAIYLMRQGTAVTAEIRGIAAAMSAEENRLLLRRTRTQRIFEIVVAISFALGILFSILLLYFAEKLIRQYAAERDTAELQIRELNADLQVRIEERTAELQETNERLSRSNKDLTHFAYVASHDLQEPLRTVGSYAGLLGRRYQGQLDERADKYIRFIVDGAKRMQTLVQDLLSYSGVGTQAFNFELVGIDDVLQQAKDNLRVSIAERRASISNDPLPQLRADATKLVLVFQNLLSNSLKFSKPGENPSIHVGARREQNEWIFSVKDNGIGFDPQYAQRIFVIFQRLHQLGTYPGTGIGLAICQRIVEAHGGKIWANSEPGAGSIFSFTLPGDVSRMSSNGLGRLDHSVNREKITRS